MKTWRDILGGSDGRDEVPPLRPTSRLAAPALRSGDQAWWQSPLFGLCRGIVLAPPADGYVHIGQHSVTMGTETGGCARIPVEWLCAAPDTGHKEER